MEQDYNKKIAKIQYNSLNLPSALQFTNGNHTDYLYSSDAMKRRLTHKTAIANISVPMGQIKDLTSSQVSQNHTTDYCGNVIYENGSLSKILTEEGYVTLSGSTPVYHYYLKDHQGNNRVVINQASTVEQVNHYYPFGGLFEVNTATSGIQSYKYNGKELDRIHGVDWYDYGARMYDGVLGRWHVRDPMAEKFYAVSLYIYCNNNPVNRIDPTGKTDYHILANGQIKRSGDIDNGPDRLFAGGKYVIVNDTKLLNGLVKNMGGDYYRRRFYQETTNIEDAVSVFKFASDNTSNEWKLDVYVDKDKSRTAVVATNLDKSSVALTDNYADDHADVKFKTKVVDIHSHPDKNGTKGGSDTDQKTAVPNIKNAVYHKETKTLFEYTQTRMSINSIKIESYEDIMKYINR